MVHTHLNDDVVCVVVAEIDNVGNDGKADIGNTKGGLRPHDDDREQEQNGRTHPVHPVTEKNFPVPL